MNNLNAAVYTLEETGRAFWDGIWVAGIQKFVR